MRSLTSFTSAVLTILCVATSVSARQAPGVSPYVKVSAPVIALTNVKLIDGTGTAAKSGQTIVMQDGRITAVGPMASTRPPRGAQLIDGTGHSVIPGIIGLHDHMYYSSVGGSMKLMINSYPRLFLAAGVTTIRTTGSVDPYQELNLRAAIEAGTVVGPDVVVTGPYLQGPAGLGAMHPLSGEDDARRMVRYWAEEGVTWFKAYTTISHDELAAAIAEAHANGVKVTAHLCSVGFREAVALGIDNLEHGLLVNTEYVGDKQRDQCPRSANSAHYASLDIDSPDVQRTIREMVDHKVGMTSTLAVMELSAADRVPMDQRVLDAVFPDAREALIRWKATADGNPPAPTEEAALKKAMEFERAFVRAGGLLGAGSDPCCLMAIAGYADQRNYELLIEAGFTPEQAVQIMSANGAKILGFADRVGTIEPGKQADLVLLQGDVVAEPASIRNVVTVFRKGVGYDPVKLTASVKGMVGIR